MKQFLPFFLTFTILAACSNGQTTETLDPTTFSEQLKNNPGAVLVDVRTPEEFAGGHIEGARNEDWNAGEFVERLQDVDPSSPVFVYCLSGGRSSSAADELRRNGFEQVYELQGGMLSWRAEGLPETTAASAPVQKGMSAADFRHLTQSETVLVDFYAPWCGPCKKMEPMLGELSERYEGNIRIVRIDVDQNPELVNTLGISGIPRLQLYCSGSLAWDHTGLVDVPILEKEIKQCVEL